jgi:Cu(I)/Ag(I) efflux system membrane protein CusA/SilA
MASAHDRFVTVGDVARVRLSPGPAMVRDEAGLLVGYVYVDLDGTRDVGGFVRDAREAIDDGVARGTITLPDGGRVRFTGQYEELLRVEARMRWLVPLTLLIVMVLLHLQFRSFTEVLIVLLSVPFALIGSVWALFLLDYRMSTAVWVGVIALVGLAAQTGVVMIVYIDHAYEKRLREGRIRSLADIVDAHAEGTIERVRPKLMTVGTMLCGLVPLLWADGSGADVMKRIAAPMVGGLVTSAFLTLEMIPVVYTYWRNEQRVLRLIGEAQPLARVELDRFVTLLRGALFALVVALGVHLYLEGADRIAITIAFAGIAGLALFGPGYAWARSRALAGIRPDGFTEPDSEGESHA